MAAFLDYYALSFNPFDKQCIITCNITVILVI